MSSEKINEIDFSNNKSNIANSNMFQIDFDMDIDPSVYLIFK